jgi:glycosyltransferase involved in cell wall biosynthesis
MTRTLLAALITLGDPGQLTGGYLFHRRIAELAPAHDARIEFVSVPQRAFPLACVDAPRVLARASAVGADAIVLDSIAAAFVGPWLAVRDPQLPLLGMLHQPPGGIDHGPLRSRVQAVLDRLAYRRARVLMAASESLAIDLRKLGYAEERVVVVPPGRDVASAPAVAPGDLRRGRAASFLCVGNWVERKGILSLLDAFAALDAESATLHLVGDDRTDVAYAEQVRHRLGRPDVHDRVVVHGTKSIEEVAAFYAAADVFALPSLKEPYGTVYGEAMAFGLPVVGWRAGNLPFLAEHEREGLLVTPGDIGGLTAALRRLADQPDLRKHLGEAARRRALERPTWDDVTQLFFEHVRAVAHRRAPA